VSHAVHDAPAPTPRQAAAEDWRQVGAVMQRNIDALRDRRREQEANAATRDRIADAITRFAGSLVFVFAHVAIVVAWVVVNLGWTRVPAFDPSFVILATVASVEAIFISTFVLISQNRAAALAERRAELDLHVNLLAEHEITRMLELLIAIGRRLGLREAEDGRLAELTDDVEPEEVLEKIEEEDAELKAKT
jgi:uncharacterized membrane protein